MDWKNIATIITLVTVIATATFTFGVYKNQIDQLQKQVDALNKIVYTLDNLSHEAKVQRSYTEKSLARIEKRLDELR